MTDRSEHGAIRPVEDYHLKGEVSVLGRGAFRALSHSGGQFSVDFPECVFISVKLNEQRSRGRVRGLGDYEKMSRIGSVTIGVPDHLFDIDIVGSAHVAQAQLSLQMLERHWMEDHDAELRVGDIPPLMAGQDPILAGLITRAILGAEQESSARAVATRLLQRRDEARGRLIERIPRKGGVPPTRLRRVIDFVQANLQSNVTLSSMAEQASMSPFHFARAFRAETGMSAYDYLLERRLTEAINLLRDGKGLLDEIALRSGFTHSNHLGRFLRRKFGVGGRDMRSLLHARSPV